MKQTFFNLNCISHKVNCNFLIYCHSQCWEFLIWMDTANFSGPRGKVPKEIQIGETSQLSETTENNEVAIEMNWNIAEHLPETGNCRAEFEAIASMFMDMLVNHSTPAESIKGLSMQSFDIVQRLHKGIAPGKESPGLHFCNALCKILSILKDVNEEVQSLRRNMLRLMGIGEFSDMAVWRDTSDTYILNEVICQACNHCRDIDLCKDKDRASLNDT